MKVLKIVSVTACLAILLTGCMPAQTTGIKEEDIDFIQLKDPVENQDMAVIHTSIGDITMMLFTNEAPNTVNHFKKLVEEKFYDKKEIFLDANVKYMMTGADDELGTKGKLVTDDKKPIVCETTQNLWHFSGAVSALGYEKSRLSKQCVSDSRFFIVGDIEPTTKLATEMEEYKYPQKVINAYKEHGGMPELTGRYTVFGQVTKGLDIVKQITEMKSDEETHKPVDSFIIENIELFKYSK